MTIGNKATNDGANVSFTTGTGFVGKRVVKSWSGGDQAVKRPARQPVVRPLVSYDKFGHKVYHWGTYRPPTRLPKRAYNELHPYSTNLSIEVTEGFSWTIDNDQTPWLDNSGTGVPGTTWGGVYTSVPLNLWSSNDDLALFGKLREKVAGSDFNAGVFLGEGHQALKMIATNATKIYKALSAVRKGRVADAAHILTGSKFESNRNYFKSGFDRKTIANNWLELQYGWLPLLSDVKGGAEFLAHHLSVPLTYKTVVRREVKNDNATILTGSPTAAYFPMAKALSRGQVIAFLKEKDVIGLSGLTDPLSVAWELLPYSFVVDWFIPIGNYLQARGLAQALTGTFVTTKTNRSEVGGYKGKTLSNAPAAGSSIVSIKNAKYSYIAITVNRTVSSTLSVPLPSVKPLSKVASWRHAANAVALLTQLKR